MSAPPPPPSPPPLPPYPPLVLQAMRDVSAGYVAVCREIGAASAGGAHGPAGGGDGGAGGACSSAGGAVLHVTAARAGAVIVLVKPRGDAERAPHIAAIQRCGPAVGPGSSIRLATGQRSAAALLVPFMRAFIGLTLVPSRYAGFESRFVGGRTNRVGTR